MESLANLKADLIELLSLTKETLNEQQNENDDDDDPFADEMRMFLSEISETERQENSQKNDVIDNNTINNDSNETLEQKFTRLKSELNSMIGQKCVAPHTHTWGSIAYHNAFICGLDETTEYSEEHLICNDDSIKIRILFTNPTHQEMIPCSYYLDGDCKFDAEKCRFSHGELVKRSQLRTYVEPNFSLLSKRKYPVLAKQSDRIWYKGCTLSSDFDQRTCRIKIELSNKEVTCNFEDILPINDNNVDSCTSTSSDLDDDDNEYIDINSEEERIKFEKQIQQSKLIEKSLLTPVSNQPLGDWEKYTKGFGSKMMQKYGYIIGTGLGQNGEGIIVPIGAQILPPGRSLDHCMILREQANGDEDLFSVERKLKKQQRRQEIINQRSYEREQKKSTNDVFKFINENVSAGFSSNGLNKPINSDAPSTSSTKIIDLKSHSQKNLNVASFQLSENIRRKERDIEKLKESISRHQIGTPMYKKLNEQMHTMNNELMQLKRSETNVSNEQIFRKNKSKLSVF